MSISNNYTSTRYVPISTSNAQAATNASCSSGVTATSEITATSDVATRNSTTYTTNAPETNTAEAKNTETKSKKPTSTEPVDTPKETKTPTVTTTPDPLLTTQTDPATGRPIKWGDVYGDDAYNASGSNNKYTVSPNAYDITPTSDFKLPEIIDGLQGIIDLYKSLPFEYKNKQIYCNWQVSGTKFSMGIGELINKASTDIVFKDGLKGFGGTFRITF